MRAALGVLLLASCGGVSADAGRDAWMQIRGGTFVRETTNASNGPVVASVDLALTTLTAGVVDSPLKGALGKGATAVSIALSGDLGHWIVPARVPGAEAPEYPTFDAPLSLSRGTPPGVYDLLVQAVDVDGRFGPVSRTALRVVRADVEGRLIVALTWDTESDLDLHVVDPNGKEIWTRARSSWVAPPGPVASDDWKNGGNLDADSNADCVIDGRRQEDVIWTRTPPSGSYVVRVDTPSLCGQAAARWDVSASLDGRLLGHASGVSLASDTRGLHQAGSGVLALRFVLP